MMWEIHLYILCLPNQDAFDRERGCRERLVGLVGVQPPVLGSWETVTQCHPAIMGHLPTTQGISLPPPSMLYSQVLGVILRCSTPQPWD